MPSGLMALLLGLTALLTAADARAQAPSPPRQLLAQIQASQLVEDARKDRDAGLIRQAAAKYRTALSLSPRSIIRYELALVLIELGEPAEAAGLLEEVVRLGPEAIDHQLAKLAHARTRLEDLLAHKLATVVVICRTEGAVVSVDGEDLFTAKGLPRSTMARLKRLEVGWHTFMAEMPGDAADVAFRRYIGPAGTTTTVELKEQWEHRRRWPGLTWEPWAMLGGGALIGLVGAQLEWDAYEANRQLDACGSSNGPSCDLDRHDELQAQVIAERRNGMIAYWIGVPMLVTGGVLAYLNRPIAHRVKDDHRREAPAPREVSIAPFAGPGVEGVMVMGRF